MDNKRELPPRPEPVGWCTVTVAHYPKNKPPHDVVINVVQYSTEWKARGAVKRIKEEAKEAGVTLIACRAKPIWDGEDS